MKTLLCSLPCQKEQTGLSDDLQSPILDIHEVGRGVSKGISKTKKFSGPQLGKQSASGDRGHQV